MTDEWNHATTVVAGMMRGEVAIPPSLPPFVGYVLINDLVVHETDVRAALAVGRAPASPALSLALAGYSFSLENRIRERAAPSLVLAYDGKERQLGDGEIGATVHADRHELVRVMAGRRTSGADPRTRMERRSWSLPRHSVRVRTGYPSERGLTARSAATPIDVVASLCR